jgi:phospho-N-acetylmuramoyl-pentapeptide-transferase
MQQTPITIPLIIENIKPALALGFASFALSMLLTPIYTTIAFKYRWWKRQRHDAVSGEGAKVYQSLHAEKHKRNIPTMAGIVTLAAVSIVTVAFNLDRGQTWLPLGAALGAGALGLIDDIINLKGSGTGIAGLNTKLKLLLMIIIASILSYWFVVKLGYSMVHIPFFDDLTLAPVIMFFGLIFVIVATANAVNITDGLDGLAGGLLVTAYASFGLIAFLQGNFGIAGFCLTIVGALLSYLWFNIYPARFFMSDVGSFALGTALAVIAIMTNSILLIPVIGLMFVVEVASAVIQLLSKRLRGKKVFLSAPIHHHFEAIGWPETKVTMRFWVLGQVAGVVGLLIAVLGGHVSL